MVTRKQGANERHLEEPQGIQVVRTHYLARLKFFCQNVSGEKLSNSEHLRYNMWHNKMLYTVSFWIREVFSYPDSQIGWRPFALEAVRNIIKTDNIMVIFSTSPPVTNHLIASELQHETGLPWVADFRDLWTQNHYYSHTVVRRKFETQLEKRVLRGATMLITVSQPLAHKLGALHKKPVEVITNGFDEDDFAGAAPQLSKVFTLTYTGRFGEIYSGRRDPSLLFSAIKHLLDSNSIDPKLLLVRFFGPESDRIELENLARHYGIQKLVKHGGFIPYKEAILQQRASTLLLLFSWDHPEEKAIYPGKIFEYLGARRPILAIPKNNGVVDELLKTTNSGFSAGTKEEIMQIIKSWYDEFINRGYIDYAGREEEINKYTRKAMTRKIAEIFEKVGNN